MMTTEHNERETQREAEIPGYSRFSGGVVTGEKSTCTYCGEGIGAVIDADSGCVDWGSYFGDSLAIPDVPADFGCSDSPDTDEDGTGGHEPGEGHTPNGFKVLIDSRTYWAEIQSRVREQIGEVPLSLSDRVSIAMTERGVPPFWGARVLDILEREIGEEGSR